MIPQTPTGMLREVLGTISEKCQKISECAMDLNTEGVKSHYLTLERSMKILDVIERDIMGAGAAVVHCAKCARCYDLDDRNPRVPYSGTGDGSFHCAKFDMDFYAPDYRAETWFCADGIPRGTGGDLMKKIQ